jgi:hypothetical protein
VDMNGQQHAGSRLAGGSSANTGYSLQVSAWEDVAGSLACGVLVVARVELRAGRLRVWSCCGITVLSWRPRWYRGLCAGGFAERICR